MFSTLARRPSTAEIWGDLNQIATDFNRNEVLSSALVRAVDPITLQALKNSMADDQRLYLEAKTESDYYAAQTTTARPVEFLGTFVAVIMAIGSSFAAMNTMYAAVARRAREIGTLRILGFSRGSICSLSYSSRSCFHCWVDCWASCWCCR